MDKLDADHLIILIDVDYYIDMAELVNMLPFPVPIVVYTLQPTAASRSVGEYSFTWTKDNEVDYKVSGGAEYNHKVWDYTADTLIAKDKCCGLLCGVTTLMVDRRQLDDHHQLVNLVPSGRFNFPWAWAFRDLLGKELMYLEPVVDGFARIYVQKKDALYVSTGEASRYCEITTTAAEDGAIANVKRLNKKMDLTLAQTQTLAVGSEKGPASAATLFHRRDEGRLEAPWTTSLEDSVQAYTHEPEECIEEQVIAVEAYMPAIVAGGCYAPYVSHGNAKRAVATRVVDVATDVRASKEIRMYCREFLEMLVPAAERRTLVPLDDDEIATLWKPGQVSLMVRSDGQDEKMEFKSMLKREAGKLTDPRVITIIDPAVKTTSARVHLAIHKWLTRKTIGMDLDSNAIPAFCCGVTPKGIARRVAEVAQKAVRHLVKTDFSRMDGRVSEACRYFEECLIAMLFRPDYLRVALAAARKQHHVKVELRTPDGKSVKYKSWWARLSGSGETSDFNSIINMLVAFIALRLSGKSMVEAWERLGVYLGDDGLTGDVFEDAYVRAAKMMGQVLTFETIPVGAVGVSFLARYYGPEVWKGDVNSCSDIRRQMVKYHSTVSLPDTVTPQQKLVEKSLSFYHTDKHTPVIGPLVCRVLQLAGLLASAEERQSIVSKSAVVGWWGKFTEDCQYLNELYDWMYDLSEAQLPGFDHVAYERWLVSCRSLSEILDAKTWYSVEPQANPSEQCVVVGPDLVKPAVTQPVPTIAALPETSASLGAQSLIPVTAAVSSCIIPAPTPVPVAASSGGGAGPIQDIDTKYNPPPIPAPHTGEPRPTATDQGHSVASKASGGGGATGKDEIGGRTTPSSSGTVHEFKVVNGSVERKTYAPCGQCGKNGHRTDKCWSKLTPEERASKRKEHTSATSRIPVRHVKGGAKASPVKYVPVKS